ncbi:MAG TPA: hypothetical protein VN372_08200, partial [Methanospirillum sp.]|nr:hypothetical protein [Methanospirillum sp.]
YEQYLEEISDTAENPVGLACNYKNTSSWQNEPSLRVVSATLLTERGVTWNICNGNFSCSDFTNKRPLLSFTDVVYNSSMVYQLLNKEYISNWNMSKKWNISWGEPLRVTSYHGEPALFEHPLGQDEMSATFQNILIKNNTNLKTSIGLDERSIGKSDGVEYKVIVISDGNQKVVLKQFVSPDPEYQDIFIPLNEYGGKTVDIQFITNVGPQGNGNSDLAYWVDPLLITQ